MEKITQTTPTGLVEWAGDIDEVGWTPPPNMTFDEWVEAGVTLQQINRSVGWWIGDWINHGETKWGEKYAQAIEYTDTSVETLKKFAAVSARVPRSIRRKELSWTHHFNVAYLPEEERGPLLEMAAQFDLSTRDTYSVARLPEEDRATLMALWVENPEMDATTFYRYMQQVIAGEFRQHSHDDLPGKINVENDDVSDSLEEEFIDPLGSDVEDAVDTYWRLRGLPLRFANPSTAQWDGIVVRATVNQNGTAVLEWEISTTREEDDGYQYPG